MTKKIDRYPRCARLAASVVAGGLSLVCLPAEAHVKWFSKIVNCMQAPMTPWAVLSSPFFLLLYVAAIAAMFGVYAVERRILPRFERFNTEAAALKAKVAFGATRLLRLGVAIYFMSLLQYGGEQYMILTPELFSPAAWVPVVQVVISLSVLWRRTEALAALGIVCLFAFAIFSYGWYHMLDYLYFLGVAAFLLADAVYGEELHYLGFAAMRFSAGVSLLWVGVEKWMYPAWTYDILNHELHYLTMGLDLPFFVMAAGFVEFTLAFLLLFGRLSSQVSSLVFLFIMAAAIPLVGMLDAVGHAPLLVVLLIFSGVQNRIGYPARHPSGWPDKGHILSFAISVPGLVGMYYFVHMLAYPAQADYSSPNTLLAVVLVGLQMWRVLTTLPQLFQLRKRAPQREAAAFRFSRELA
jgi:hypothetical protein